MWRFDWWLILWLNRLQPSWNNSTVWTGEWEALNLIYSKITPMWGWLFEDQSQHNNSRARARLGRRMTICEYCETILATCFKMGMRHKCEVFHRSFPCFVTWIINNFEFNSNRSCVTILKSQLFHIYSATSRENYVNHRDARLEAIVCLISNFQ